MLRVGGCILESRTAGATILFLRPTSSLGLIRRIYFFQKYL